MDKSDCGNFRPGESLARYLCIWRCQNRYEGANDWGNTVERYLDGFYGLGMLRFYGLLSSHWDFQLRKLAPGAKNGGFLDRDARFFLQNSGVMVFPR
jgi:hypothetical protein